MQLEGTCDQLGWLDENVPFFGLIHKHQNGIFSVLSTGLPLTDDVNFGTFRLGHLLAEHLADESLKMAKLTALPEFYGCALVYTGLGLAPGSPPWNRPKNLRIIVAVDINGVAYRVEHLDGYETSIENSRDDAPFEGDLGTEGLRLFTLAVTRHMEGAHEYGKALMDLNLNLTIDLPECGDGIHTHDT